MSRRLPIVVAIILGLALGGGIYFAPSDVDHPGGHFTDTYQHNGENVYTVEAETVSVDHGPTRKAVINLKLTDFGKEVISRSPEEIVELVRSEYKYTKGQFTLKDAKQLKADTHNLVGESPKRSTHVQKGELYALESLSNGKFSQKIRVKTSSSVRLKFGSDSTIWTTEATVTSPSGDTIGTDWSSSGDYLYFTTAGGNVEIYNNGTWTEHATIGQGDTEYNTSTGSTTINALDTMPSEEIFGFTGDQDLVYFAHPNGTIITKRATAGTTNRNIAIANPDTSNRDITWAIANGAGIEFYSETWNGTGWDQQSSSQEQLQTQQDVEWDDNTGLYVFGGNDNVLHFYNKTDDVYVANVTMDARVRAVAWSPSGNYVAATESNGTYNKTRIFDTSGDEVASVTNTVGQNRLEALDWSEDGEWLASGSDYYWHVYNVSDGYTIESESYEAGDMDELKFHPNSVLFSHGSTTDDLGVIVGTGTSQNQGSGVNTSSSLSFSDSISDDYPREQVMASGNLQEGDPYIVTVEKEEDRLEVEAFTYDGSSLSSESTVFIGGTLDGDHPDVTGIAIDDIASDTAGEEVIVTFDNTTDGVSEEVTIFEYSTVGGFNRRTTYEISGEDGNNTYSPRSPALVDIGGSAKKEVVHANRNQLTILNYTDAVLGDSFTVADKIKGTFTAPASVHNGSFYSVNASGEIARWSFMGGISKGASTSSSIDIRVTHPVVADDIGIYTFNGEGTLYRFSTKDLSVMNSREVADSTLTDQTSNKDLTLYDIDTDGDKEVVIQNLTHMISLSKDLKMEDTYALNESMVSFNTIYRSTKKDISGSSVDIGGGYIYMDYTDGSSVILDTANGEIVKEGGDFSTSGPTSDLAPGYLWTSESIRNQTVNYTDVHWNDTAAIQNGKIYGCIAAEPGKCGERTFPGGSTNWEYNSTIYNDDTFSVTGEGRIYRDGDDKDTSGDYRAVIITSGGVTEVTPDNRTDSISAGQSGWAVFADKSELRPIRFKDGDWNEQWESNEKFDYVNLNVDGDYIFASGENGTEENSSVRVLDKSNGSVVTRIDPYGYIDDYITNGDNTRMWILSDDNELDPVYLTYWNVTSGERINKVDIGNLDRDHSIFGIYDREGGSVVWHQKEGNMFKITPNSPSVTRYDVGTEIGRLDPNDDYSLGTSVGLDTIAIWDTDTQQMHLADLSQNSTDIYPIDIENDTNVEIYTPRYQELLGLRHDRKIAKTQSLELPSHPNSIVVIDADQDGANELVTSSPRGLRAYDSTGERFGKTLWENRYGRKNNRTQDYTTKTQPSMELRTPDFLDPGTGNEIEVNVEDNGGVSQTEKIEFNFYRNDSMPGDSGRLNHTFVYYQDNNSVPDPRVTIIDGLGGGTSDKLLLEFEPEPYTAPSYGTNDSSINEKVWNVDAFLTADEFTASAYNTTEVPIRIGVRVDTASVSTTQTAGERSMYSPNLTVANDGNVYIDTKYRATDLTSPDSSDKIYAENLTIDDDSNFNESTETGSPQSSYLNTYQIYQTNTKWNSSTLFYNWVYVEIGTESGTYNGTLYFGAEEDDG